MFCGVYRVYQPALLHRSPDHGKQQPSGSVDSLGWGKKSLPLVVHGENPIQKMWPGSVKVNQLKRSSMASCPKCSTGATARDVVDQWPEETTKGQR